MDHLRIAGRVTLPRPGVYFRTKETKLLDFFAVAKGETGWDVTKAKLVCNFESCSDNLRKSQNTFIQGWLFFGFIKEVFKDDSALNLENFYISEPGTAEAITTEPLIKLIENWYERERQNPHDRYRSLMRIRKVLDHAKSFARRFSVSRGAAGHMGVQWPIDDYLALSILVLGQTLSHAWYQIMAKLEWSVGSQTLSDAYEEGWGSSRLVLERLKQDWPPDAIKKLQRFWKNNTIGLLLTLNFSQWKHYSGKTPDVYPFYCTCHQKCPFVGADSKVFEALRAGRIPLFRYHPKQKQLQVEEMDETFNKSYAIFSHIWSHGFGNPSKNELQLCLLKKFHDLFSDVQREDAALSRVTPDGEPSELFWIDTLGIPVGSEDDLPKLRGKVIAQMHNIYKNAKYTIVLDKGLMDEDRGLMGEDKMMRDYTRMATMISMSGWSRRLWTLQESILSKQLYFNFSNELCRADRLEDRYRDEEKNIQTSTAPKLARIYHHLILEDERRRLSYSQQPHHNDTDHFMNNLWSATRWRETAQPRHETLALSIILDTYTDDLAEAHAPDYKGSPSKLMQIFLSLLSKVPGSIIPAGLIFLPGPHLKAKGYGWAPESWFLAQEEAYVDTLTEKYPPTRLLGEYGLQVELSGFKLRDFEHHCDKLQDRESFSFPVGSTDREWYRVKRADQDDDWPTLAEFNRGQAAIICSRANAFYEEQIGLLVSIKMHNKRDVITAYIMRRVLVLRELDTSAIAQLEQDLTDSLTDSGALYFCFGQALPPTQRWQVDRFPSSSVSTQTALQPTPQPASQTGFQAASQAAPQASPVPP